LISLSFLYIKKKKKKKGTFASWPRLLVIIHSRYISSICRSHLILATKPQMAWRGTQATPFESETADIKFLHRQAKQGRSAATLNMSLGSIAQNGGGGRCRPPTQWQAANITVEYWEDEGMGK
jgi:hypothetical protein